MPAAVTSPHRRGRRFPRRFYRRDPVTVARALLGQKLVRVIGQQRMAGMIIETEAYLGAMDKAAHTYQGRRTRRNQSMWGDGGHTYVYFTYGMHHCLNVVASVIDDPVAVLIRALEPVEGIKLMYARRPAACRETDLCSGPGRLCQALGIDRTLDGVDLVDCEHLFIEQQQRRHDPRQVRAKPRIGINYAEQWARKPLRFLLSGNRYVSRP